jgi:hypothetical protein
MPLEDQQSVDPRLRRQFDYYRKRLAAKGVYAGTHHKRIVIDKTRMGLERLKQLGFVPVKIAIPEAGQDQLTSYRHPHNNFHIHSHPGVWTMHEDEHPAATMIMKSRPTLLGKAMALVEGVPHAITEGVPGAAIYLKNQAKGLLPNVEAPDMLQAIFRDRQETKNPQTKSAAYELGVQQALSRFKLSEASPDGPCSGKPKCKGCLKCMAEPAAKPLKA